MNLTFPCVHSSFNDSAHIHTHPHTHTHAHTHTHTYAHTHIRTCTHTYAHAHTHTHTHAAKTSSPAPNKKSTVTVKERCPLLLLEGSTCPPRLWLPPAIYRAKCSTQMAHCFCSATASTLWRPGEHRIGCACHLAGHGAYASVPSVAGKVVNAYSTLLLCVAGKCM